MLCNYNLPKRPTPADHNPRLVRSRCVENSTVESTTIEQSAKQECAGEGINKFPSEILVLIFELLDMPTRMRIERVCKRWLNIARNHSWRKTTKFNAKEFRKTVFANGDKCVSSEIWKKKLHSLISRCAPYLKNLSLHPLHIFTDFTEIWELVLSQIPAAQLDYLDTSHLTIDPSQLNLVADRFSTLKSVVFYSSIADASSLAHFLKSCFSLEHLDLFGIDLTKVSFQGMPSTLTSLNMSNCRGVDDVKLAHIGVRCSQLKSLFIEGLYEKTKFSSEVLNDMLYKLERLHELALTAEDELEMPDFARIPQLKTLKIESCEWIDIFTLASIGKCSQLHNLVLLPYLPADEAISKEELRHLTNLTRLKCLHLCKLKEITVDLLMEIARNNPSLKALRVPGCEQITNECLLHVLDHCPQLENMIIGQCPQVTSEGLKQVLRKLNTMFDGGEKSFSLFCSTSQMSQEMSEEYACSWLEITCYSDNAEEWDYEYP